MDFATLVSDCEPVSKAEAAAAAAGPVPAKASPTPTARRSGERKRRKAPPTPPAPAAPVAAPAPPPPVFAPGRARSKDFPLDWPVAYDGVTYTTIVLRRPSAAEVGAYFEALAEGAQVVLPIFFTPEGESVPFQVVDALDPDDDDRIMGALNDFLPDRLLRAFAAVSGPSSTPPSGETIAPTSSTSSEAPGSSST